MRGNELGSVARTLPDSQPAPGGPLVSVSGLSKRYGDVVAVDSITFSLKRGTITGFLGPNNAGKMISNHVLAEVAQTGALS